MVNIYLYTDFLCPFLQKIKTKQLDSETDRGTGKHYKNITFPQMREVTIASPMAEIHIEKHHFGDHAGSQRHVLFGFFFFQNSEYGISVKSIVMGR